MPTASTSAPGEWSGSLSVASMPTWGGGNECRRADALCAHCDACRSDRPLADRSSCGPEGPRRSVSGWTFTLLHRRESTRCLISGGLEYNELGRARFRVFGQMPTAPHFQRSVNSLTVTLAGRPAGRSGPDPSRDNHAASAGTIRPPSYKRRSRRSTLSLFSISDPVTVSGASCSVSNLIG